MTMDLSNILQAIGADDVTVCDWSTAEPLLDVILINLYECRLCQNRSLNKSKMVEHLSACHANEWEISSCRTKELMKIINKRRDELKFQSETKTITSSVSDAECVCIRPKEPVNIMNKSRDDSKSVTKSELTSSSCDAVSACINSEDLNKGKDDSQPLTKTKQAITCSDAVSGCTRPKELINIINKSNGSSQSVIRSNERLMNSGSLSVCSRPNGQTDITDDSHDLDAEINTVKPKGLANLTDICQESEAVFATTSTEQTMNIHSSSQDQNLLIAGNRHKEIMNISSNGHEEVMNISSNGPEDLINITYNNNFPGLVNSNKAEELTSINCSNQNAVISNINELHPEPDLHDLCSNNQVINGDGPTVGASETLKTISVDDMPIINQIGRLATRIIHPLFLVSSLPKVNTFSTQGLGLQETLNRNYESNRGVGLLSVKDGTIDQQNSLTCEINKTGSTVPTSLPCSNEWALQAKSNFAMFSQSAQMQPRSPPKIHLCPHCPTRFTTKTALYKHQDIHSGQLVHCDLCDFTSVWNTSLKKHKQLRHFPENLPILSCAHCNYKTKNSDNMRRHKRTVHCRNGLSTQPLTKTPAYNIAVSKIYTCDHCSKRFTTKRARKKHQDIHNGTIIKCDLCDFTSVWSASIKKHKLLRHFREDLPMLYCPQCSFHTKNSDNLRRHRRIIHEKDVLAHDNMSADTSNIIFNPHFLSNMNTKMLESEVNPQIDESVKNDQRDVNNVHMESGQNEDLMRDIVLKLPKQEPTDVYIESNAQVHHYLDVDFGQNNGLAKGCSTSQ